MSSPNDKDHPLETTNRYVSDRQLAKRYSVTRRTIWRWANNGTLPQPHRICGCTRWDLAEIKSEEEMRAQLRTA